MEHIAPGMRSHLYHSSVGILLLLCISCGQHRPATTSTTADSTALPSREQVKQDTAFEDPLMEAKEIDAALLLRPRHVVIDTPDPRIILRTLFPGNYYELHYDEDIMSVTAWTSKRYPVKQYETWLTNETQPFPVENDNMTFIADTIRYTGMDGSQNILVEFATTDIESPEVLFCGRFACSIMGLACFTQKGDKWQLQAFSPALGCFGSYRKVPDIRALDLGSGKLGCMLYNSNGGPGSAYFSDIYVFAPFDGRYRCVLRENGTSLGNILYSGWGSNAALRKTAGNMPGIDIVINGNYNKRSILSEMISMADLPREIKATAAKKDSFNFDITRHYMYLGKGYSKRSADLSITDYDPDR